MMEAKSIRLKKIWNKKHSVDLVDFLLPIDWSGRRAMSLCCLCRTFEGTKIIWCNFLFVWVDTAMLYFFIFLASFFSVVSYWYTCVIFSFFCKGYVFARKWTASFLENYTHKEAFILQHSFLSFSFLSFFSGR